MSEKPCGAYFFAFFENFFVPILTSGGYVGLSIATLLSQHHEVHAVDIVPEKVDLINNKKSPIQDDYIEKYLAEKDLNLTATLDAKEAYSDADFVVIAAPTNYDSKVSKALRAYFEFIYTTLVWKPNLVHVHTSFGGSFYRKALIIEMASLAKIPVINHVHGAEFDEFYRRKSQRKKKAIEKIYNKCIRTIALSEEWKKNLAEIVPEQTISVVENYGILQEDLIKEKFTKPNHKMILFLGFICERKGCLDIPAIVDQVCRKIPDVQLLSILQMMKRD